MRKNKILILFASATLAVVAVSCSKTAPKASSKLVEVSIKAGYSGIASFSKTTLEGTNVCWVSGDSIAVFTENGEMFKLGTTQSGSTAIFKGKLPENAGSLTAIYPVEAATDYANGKISANLNHSQRPVLGGFDPAAAIIVAKGEFAGDNTTLNFTQACGLVRFEIVSDDIKSVELNSPAGVFICGNVNVPDESETPKVDFGMRTITATPQSSACFEKGVYYLSAWPVAAKNGFTLTFNGDGGSTVKTLGSDFCVKRGRIWIISRDADVNVLF